MADLKADLPALVDSLAIRRAVTTEGLSAADGQLVMGVDDTIDLEVDDLVGTTAQLCRYSSAPSMPSNAVIDGLQSSGWFGSTSR